MKVEIDMKDYLGGLVEMYEHVEVKADRIIELEAENARLRDFIRRYRYRFGQPQPLIDTLLGDKIAGERGDREECQ